MNLVIIGNGEYEDSRWVNLEQVPLQNDRLADYVKEYWPGATIITEGAERAWSAADLRNKLPDWLNQSKKADDVLILWNGHGFGQHSQHRLMTYDSPDPDRSSITSENSFATNELADYLIDCRARRVVLLLNTCWSGDGGQDLGVLIGNAMNEAPAFPQKRSMVIISSARREEARDGAFLGSIFDVLGSPAPPSRLAQELSWTPATQALTAEQLVAAANLFLEDHNHQAQIITPYGTLGSFFRRIRASAAAPAQLPPRVVERMLSEFPGLLSEMPGPWDIGKLRSAIPPQDKDMLADVLRYRLSRLILGLATLTFLEDWLGAGAGLANRLSPAWQAVLLPIHRLPQPVDRFGYIEQVVLHGTDSKVVEFAARVIKGANQDPCNDRFYQWAETELRVDRQVVDDALSRITSSQPQSRLIVNFGMTIADDDESDSRPKSVIGWLYRQDGPPLPPREIPFDPPDVAELVAQMVTWARHEVGELSQVDVALPVSLFCAENRPEAARITLHKDFRRPVAASTSVVIRWSSRILDAGLRYDGLAQGRVIAAASAALEWIEPGAYSHVQELFEALEKPARAVAFSFKPEDSEYFYAATHNSPYVIWPESGDTAEVQEKLSVHWQDLPRKLAEAFSSQSSDHDAMRLMRVVWDDPDWLENIVPNLIVPTHRLSI